MQGLKRCGDITQRTLATRREIPALSAVPAILVGNFCTVVVDLVAVRCHDVCGVGIAVGTMNAMSTTVCSTRSSCEGCSTIVNCYAGCCSSKW